MRYRGGRFKQHQAQTRIARDNPPPDRAVSKREEIALVVITAQGKLEAILAGRRPVACAGAATIFRQYRLYVIAEAPLESLFHRLDLDLRGCALPPHLHRDGRSAILDWNQ